MRPYDPLRGDLLTYTVVNGCPFEGAPPGAEFRSSNRRIQRRDPLPLAPKRPRPILCPHCRWPQRASGRGNPLIRRFRVSTPEQLHGASSCSQILLPSFALEATVPPNGTRRPKLANHSGTIFRLLSTRLRGKVQVATDIAH